MKINLNKENSILMIIDIQERLAPVIEGRDLIVKNTKILLETAKELELPVIITEQYPEGLGSTIDEVIGGSDKYSDSTFSKISFSAYTEEIKKKLRTLNKNTIIIAGMETHICVFQTARDLIQAGYEVFIVSDAVGSRSRENYLNGLDLLKLAGSTITNTETVVFDLLKVAGTSEFKKLSQLIK